MLKKEHNTHLYPKKVNFDAVDFSARHSKEAMFHLKLSAVFLTSFNPLYITAMYKKLQLNDHFVTVTGLL